MYTVSFYSFKGGVGRTMALANVGARLAQTGRKVLMVDFDLEAPGLGTYDFPKPEIEVPGVVEFINEYIKTNRAPKVNDYIYHSPGFGKKGGDLWMMPAGVQDEEYAVKFSQIDWQALYAKREGFLLLEDLKKQWENLGVDYVLIDSRTGHSDVVGICTRQLPDAVVMMMFPNTQNLIGLRKVVSDIRSQKKLTGEKDTKLHFVVSNVPDLDDENQILADTLEKFKEQLGYDRPSAIIHRYQSLALLNQDVFAVTRPRTRLALEYFEVVDEITKYNDEDKEGALDFLRSTLRASRYREIQVGAAELQKRLDSISNKHSDDKDILFALGEVFARQGKEEQALELYDAAHKQGLKTAELYISMARLQEALDHSDDALESIREALQLQELTYFEFIIAARILSKVAPKELETISTSPALLSMDASDQIQVADNLSKVKGAFDVSESIIHRVRNEARSPEVKEEGGLTLVLGQINQQRYDDAIAELSRIPDDKYPDVLAVVPFNLGMAKWGQQQSPDAEIFQRVIEVENKHSKNVNYLQCMALAYYVVGDMETAGLRVKKAKRILAHMPKRSFSAWTYDEVSPKDYKEHLQEMQRMISGEKIIPRVFRQVSTGDEENS